MQALKKYFFVSFVFILITSQAYFNGFVIGEIISEHELKTEGLIIVKIGEDHTIEKGVQNVKTFLKEYNRPSRIIEIDTSEQLTSTLFKYNLYQIAIVTHGSENGITINDGLYSWEIFAKLFNNRKQVTYFLTCYSYLILSHINDQKAKMLTFAPWKGLVDQKIAALSIGATFLAVHGETKKAVSIMGDMLASNVELILNPVDILGYAVPLNQWVYDVNLYFRSYLEGMLSAVINSVIAYGGGIIGVTIAIIAILMMVLDTARSWLFFTTELGIGLPDLVDIYYDYTYVNGLVLPFVITIPFIGDFFMGGLSWDTDTYMDIYHYVSNTVFRVKNHLILLGVTVGGILTLGFSSLSWYLISSEPISGGSGCPILYVYDGSEYTEEGLLDIHNADGLDVVTLHTLETTPFISNFTISLRLTEHHQTHSSIDQVKLYVFLENGRFVQLPLLSAIHSTQEEVTAELMFSDDLRTTTLGADLNNGTSEFIDLYFLARPFLDHSRVLSYIFMIEGYNPFLK